MLFIELPQIPSSWQSPQILLPFPSDVSASPRELTYGKGHMLYNSIYMKGPEEVNP